VPEAQNIYRTMISRVALSAVGTKYTLLKTCVVPSESRPKLCSTISVGRLSTSIYSFYKYFAPPEQIDSNETVPEAQDDRF